MPKFEKQVDKKHYFRKKYDDLGRFISYFYQIDLTRNAAQKCLLDSGRFINDQNSVDRVSILEVGKGNGFFSDYMKKMGYNVKTADLDAELNPDYVADIKNLPIENDSFDVVTAFEVLEHIPFDDVPAALGELKRVSKRYVVISVPYKSTGCEWILKFPGIRTLIKKPFIDFFVRIPLKFGGIKVSGQHYWEIDAWRTRKSKVRRMLKQFFRIVQELSPPLNKYHYFFVLEK